MSQKKLMFLLTAVMVACWVQPTLAQLVITGIIDGPLSGGLPKAVELYAVEDIADLSIYGLGCANNGGGSDGQEFTFPADAATKGQFIYVSQDSDHFFAFFGFYPDYRDHNSTYFNGDDAIELFRDGVVVDIFGDIDVDGTGEPWEYLDGWAYRKNGTGPDGDLFNLDNWFFSGPNALDGKSTNASSETPFPLGTYEPPVAVELVLFNAHQHVRDVIIAWKTASEINCAGYYVQRRSAADGSFERLNSAIIFARGDAGRGADYNFVDECPPLDCLYRLEELDLNGVSTLYGPVQASLASAVNSGRADALFELQQNYPNPFNAATTISYSLQADADVLLQILNLQGIVVRTLIDGHQSRGVHSTIWHGRDDWGKELPSGLYLSQLWVGDRCKITKLSLLR